jgi:hypothetical protein
MGLRKLVCWLTSFIIVVAAVFRGYYLLGTGFAVVFGLLSALVLFVVWRVFLTARGFGRGRKAIVLVFAACVLPFVAFPAFFSHDLGCFIEDHRIERLTQTQLETAFGSSPKFANLHFSCRFTKCIVVEIDGTVSSQADLRELRQTIFDTCPHVSSRWLFWNVTIEDSRIGYDNKCDIDFVPAWGGIGIDGKPITRAGQL